MLICHTKSVWHWVPHMKEASQGAGTTIAHVLSEFPFRGVSDAGQAISLLTYLDKGAGTSWGEEL